MSLGFIWIPYILTQKIKNNAVPTSALWGWRWNNKIFHKRSAVSGKPSSRGAAGSWALLLPLLFCIALPLELPLLMCFSWLRSASLLALLVLWLTPGFSECPQVQVRASTRSIGRSRRDALSFAVVPSPAAGWCHVTRVHEVGFVPRPACCPVVSACARPVLSWYNELPNRWGSGVLRSFPQL